MITALMVLGPATPIGGGGPSEAAHVSKRKCFPRAATTVRMTTSVRVYRLREQHHACWRHTGATKRLDRRDESHAYVYDVRGSHVAYEYFETTRDGSAVLTRSLDVRTGRFTVNVEAFTGGARIADRDPVRAITAMSLLSSGAVAWISPLPSGNPALEVRYAAPDDVRLLDMGTDVEPDSLAVSRRHVFWWRAGAKGAEIG